MRSSALPGNVILHLSVIAIKHDELIKCLNRWSGSGPEDLPLKTVQLDLGYGMAKLGGAQQIATIHKHCKAGEATFHRS